MRCLMKTIILYYSRTRKTSLVAKTLAGEIDADLTEIIDLKDRMGAIRYISSVFDALRENKTRIKPDNIDLNEYSLIYIGTPTWASKPAPAIISIIDRIDLKDKDVILFSTMGNSGGTKVIERMREKVEARGGKIKGSFSIKTSGNDNNDIINKTKKVITDMD